MPASESPPTIDYPRPWDFKIIGTNEPSLRAAVQQCLTACLPDDGREYELQPSRTSRDGRYLSLHLRLVVQDQAERDAIFLALGDHDDVRLVI